MEWGAEISGDFGTGPLVGDERRAWTARMSELDSGRIQWVWAGSTDLPEKRAREAEELALARREVGPALAHLEGWGGDGEL